MDRKISYVNKDFADFRQALIDYTKQYYPELSDNFNDASVGSWLMDVVAGVSDSLSYHIDRAFQETNINTAQQEVSLYNLARNNGVKIPGPKGSVAEFMLTCVLPVNSGVENKVTTTRTPNWALAPIVKKGTTFTNGSILFELDHDVDFSQAFDNNGVPNRTIELIKDSNEMIKGFRVSKHFVASAGSTRIFKKEIKRSDITPFMEIILPYNDIMGVHSIICKEGVNHQLEPSLDEFMFEEEYVPANITQGSKDIYRYFEVDSLIEPYRWAPVLDSTYSPIKSMYGFSNGKEVIPSYYITKGEWKPLKQKFVTEYTDKGYLKVIFGAGHKYIEDEYTLGDAASHSKHLITKIVNNDALGVTPKANTTMYILYRVGAGSGSNLPKGAINKIGNLQMAFSDCRYETEMSTETAAIKSSLTVINTTPAIMGRDMLTGEELRNYIKYNKGAQDRCVTLNDYRSRIMQMPCQYGMPYRVGVTEENNKIMIYLLGLDLNGKLTTDVPSAFIKNLESYLSEYRMINDFIEMKAGRIINISFEIDCYINKSFNGADVVSSIVNKVNEYMNPDKHQMGDDIFLGDLEKEISLIDGVINLMDLRVYNEYGSRYSSTQTTQQVKENTECFGATSGELSMDRSEIDLDASDHILYTENDTMLEIKYPEQNIRVRFKQK